MKQVLMTVALAVATLVTACGPPDDASEGSDARQPEAAQPGPMPMGEGMAEMHRRMMGGEPGEAPEAVAAPASAAECPDVEQALVDRGRDVFSGAGACASCHGGDATGTQLAPDLADAEWLNVDGSYGSIAGVVRSGVARPRQYPAPMPSRGGAALSDVQVCAVAAYVYSLSH